MNAVLKQKVPLLFLVGIALWWGFYYRCSSQLNDFGAANYEWLYLIDGLLVLPALCFLCIKDKKEAALKALALGGVAVLIGSYIIPEQSKFIWRHLESGRYLVLAVFLLLEAAAILTVYLAIKSALDRRTDPDLAISGPIQGFLGDSALARMLAFETRMWTYALLSNSIERRHFVGDRHFSYHLKDGAQSNLLGFMLIIAIEMPVLHLLLHFIWSPFAAGVVTLSTLFGLAFFMAEYRAVSRRPISLTHDNLIIRYGIYAPRSLALAGIESIDKNSAFIRRSRSVKRYNYSGNPNVVIALAQPEGTISAIYLGVDDPDALIAAVKEAKDKIDVARPRTCPIKWDGVH